MVVLACFRTVMLELLIPTLLRPTIFQPPARFIVVAIFVLLPLTASSLSANAHENTAADITIETFEDTRQVLGQAIQRLSIEPAQLPFSLCFRQPSGAQICTDRQSPSVLESVDPGASLTIELPNLADVRVRLFDDAHRLVPSSDRFSTDAIRTLYQIVPEAPLTPGSKYSLRVDGLIDSLPTAANGTTYRNTRISFQTSGQKPPKEIVSKKSNKSKPNNKKKSSKSKKPKKKN
jgi:hypothetical protein